ncbi:hypothetical protein HME9302_00002 [Alteripontixanthobacter maritimus]|uniref:Uncharacterized protein n=1 Tax=Alteripontixanthobacter maritimus TaxID=2161824 RepID=A0A369QNU0_9SPHN|nr:phage tail terminator-like protein [Alteripontixanthobacter maritimus]RDC66551.1 hypothetical protein HME9302_00002 [Alteripontixanthobacter maritimus]
MNAIEKAIGQHLAGMTNCPPIAWPNKDFTPNGTYIEFRHAPNERRDDTIDAAGAYQIGLVLLTVVSAKDVFTTAANDTAARLWTAFPKVCDLRRRRNRLDLRSS